MKKKSSPSKLTVTVPAAFTRAIKHDLAELGIPVSETPRMLEEELAAFLRSPEGFDPFCVYVFPTRAAAERAVKRRFKLWRGSHKVDAWFWQDGKECGETFTNPKPSSNVRVEPDNTALVALTHDEVRELCLHLEAELEGDTPYNNQRDSGDFAGIVKAWRRHSARYVAWHKRADPLIGLKFNPEWREGVRQTHDETANLLEKLIRYLPKESVAASA